MFFCFFFVSIKSFLTLMNEPYWWMKTKIYLPYFHKKKCEKCYCKKKKKVKSYLTIVNDFYSNRLRFLTDCDWVSQEHHITILQSLFSHSFSSKVLLAPVRALRNTVCTSMKKTSFFLAEARICLASLAFMASGFSHSTFFLAFIKSRQVLRWYGWITPMYTTSADTHTHTKQRAHC